MRKIDELRDPASCWNKARDYEPVFVLLGRDSAAGAAIRAWCARRVALGKNDLGDREILEALTLANEIEAEHRRDDP